MTADDKMALSVMVTAAASAVVLSEENNLLLNFVKPKRRHKVWVRPWIEDREDEDQCNTAYKFQRQLEDCDVTEFGRMLRMPPDAFGFILKSIRHRIERADTNYRTCIGAEEHLSLTLKYLATGESPISLSHQYRVGRCTVGRIIKDTCRAIYEVLGKIFIKTPTTVDGWKDIVTQFHHRWNYPACIGAVDGKHVCIAQPWKTGSNYFNYKDFFSVVEMAVVNANYEYIYLDVGAEGRNADGGTWRNTTIHHAIENATLQLPPPVKLPGPDGSEIVIPCHFVGDDAFAMTTRLLKPYSVNRPLDDCQAIFNYRLSRARRIVENVFGITVSRFRVLTSIMMMNPTAVSKVLLAIATLHNILRRVCGAAYMPPGSIDSEDINYELVEGEWRRDDFGQNIRNLDPTTAKNPTNKAKDMREELADYFSGPGEVAWQYRHIHNTFDNLIANIDTA